MKTLKTNLWAGMALTVLAVIAVLASCKKSNVPDPGGVTRPGFHQHALTIINTLSNGLVAYWPLSKTAYDFSGNGHNGTLDSVTATTDRMGHVSGAYAFNGRSSYISVPNASALNLDSTDFTLNAWVDLSAYNSSYASIVVGKRLTGINNGWSWGITGSLDSPQKVVNLNPGTTPDAKGSIIVGLNGWHMISSIYHHTGKTVDIYVDSVFDHTVTGVSGPSASSTAALYIGRDDPSTHTTYFLKGAISDVRIYNRAITTTELGALYKATTAPTQGNIAFWPLTNTTQDFSGHRNQGTGYMISPATDRFGNSIGAYSFDGTSSYVSVPDSTLLSLNGTDFTLNAWVNLTSNNSSYASSVLSKRGAGTNNGWSWGINGSLSSPTGVVSYNPGVSPYGTGTVTVGLNGWHMITSVYDHTSQTFSIYVDNVFDHTTTGVSSPSATSALLYIGRDDPATGTSYFLKGALNDIRIYNRALSTTEIGQLYNALD